MSCRQQYALDGRRFPFDHALAQAAGPSAWRVSWVCPAPKPQEAKRQEGNLRLPLEERAPSHGTARHLAGE